MKLVRINVSNLFLAYTLMKSFLFIQKFLLLNSIFNWAEKVKTTLSRAA